MSAFERTSSINDGMDYSGDAAVGSFFSSDYKRENKTSSLGTRFGDWVHEGVAIILDIKNDDLKQMLDSNRDNLKLEAMKRIIGMVAKGRDASDLFAAVVKNVVSKNTEVKKLVYVYLVRYAEEQQDLALLSISTFQRALKDPNQLIRGSALRVLSSIRVTVIVPIVMLAIRDSSSDMSPYVRKTAAHAIPKLYSLDPEQKEELVQIIDKLLSDKTTLVVGSAVMAFEEVCPERIDLIHKNFRKLCALLVDIDEWGQVVILNMLTRYGRSQFTDPNIGDVNVDGEENNKPFYDEDADSDEEKKPEKENKIHMDSDHRLLLKNSRPLLQSRNAAVVMAVAQLYHHMAPKVEVHIVIKALIRLLRSHVEVQSVVLTSIAAMSTDRKALFEPYMKSFFVRSGDPTQIKILKLEVLTNIANETNIPPILREFQTYISSQDKEFVAATIQAIGRCASNIKEVAETCLNGLVSLLSHPDPAVVGGAVVVAKTLLQSQRSGNKAVIAQLAKMVDRVSVPPARAAILWLLGEHSERIPHLPPDVLRKMAKTFPEEEEMVKLQILNLAAKLQLRNPEQTSLLCQYVFNLAKYDASYDIRDRARLLRQLLFPDSPNRKLAKYAKKILLGSKPAPVLQSKFKDRDHYQLGSLSHFLNTRANGYQDLPPFPTEAPDPTVRNVEPPPTSPTLDFSPKIEEKGKKKKKTKETTSKSRSFYSDSEGENKKDENSSSSSSSSDSSSSSSGTDDSEPDSPSDSDAEVKKKVDVEKKGKTVKKVKAEKKEEKKVIRYDKSGKGFKTKSESDTSGSTEEKSDDSDSAQSDSSFSDEPKKKPKGEKKKAESEVKNGKASYSNVDLLLDLDFDTSGNGVGSGSIPASMPGSMSGSLSGATLLLPTASPSSSPLSPGSALSKSPSYEKASSMFIPNKTSELLSKMVSGGMQISSKFLRTPHLASSKMLSIELHFFNSSKDSFKNVHISNKNLPIGMSMKEFQQIDCLESNKGLAVVLGIDFNDTTQEAKFEISWANETDAKKYQVAIKSPIGELLRPISISQTAFTSEHNKLKGMNEHEAKMSINSNLNGASNRQALAQKVYETANILQVPSIEDDIIRFAGESISSQVLVLMTIHFNDSGAKIVVNCEKIVVGSMLLQEMKEALK